ncbi:CCCH-type zinc finger domain-containing protein [Tetraselmis virus 1]|uniref:CCCH-type zinc finger domain-containing protein n=1 Tax=Tetraselmis virus 1 TaxID=2060617 RepID=A0A2P0VN70_9VIRU|nr:CCCH-type zinc finger domain-containing protein [Tetraselmis virus 1]AUF82320.1 CCCH-type zinc finger domain-containing protein [Tetraselmis virus 1]
MLQLDNCHNKTSIIKAPAPIIEFSDVWSANIPFDTAWLKMPKRSKKTKIKNTHVKTEICKQYKEKGWCSYGNKCCFAHGYKELRHYVDIVPQYKTNLCKNYHKNGECPYGHKCLFIH